MILKRLYLPTRSYGYYFHPEITTYHEFIDFANENPSIDCHGLDNASYVIDCLSHEEQDTYWYNCIRNIMTNTRDVLDNLEYYCEFKTRWNNYGKHRRGAGCPPEGLTKDLNKYNWVG